MGDGLQQQISLPTEKSKAGGVVMSGGNNRAIMIKESNIGGVTSDKADGKDNTKVVNYETFESSSEDEFSQGAFESACQSLNNKEKNPGLDISEAMEQKRIERQRRKERKFNEKLKTKMEQDRQKRKNIRKKFRLQSMGVDLYDEYQDDMLNFKDSERESVISYLEDP
jgi:hypothetical protein